MNTPVPYAQGNVVQGEVLQPTAIASGKESAVHDLGHVLRDLIHGASHAFPDEARKDAAIRAVDKYVDSHVPVSAQRALRTGDERAGPK